MRMTLSKVVALCLFGTSAWGCIGASLPKLPSAGGPAWREITTEHFVVDTDLEPAASDALVKQLENLRQVMIEAVFEHDPEPSPKLRVLAVRSDEYGHYGTKTTGKFINSLLFQ